MQPTASSSTSRTRSATRTRASSLTTTGCQTLTGDQALAISRARELQYFSGGSWHYDPTWEYGRQRREQILLRVMAAHTAKKSLGNPLTAAKVISTLTSNNRLAVDNQVSTSELIDLAANFAGFDAAAMKTFSLPTVTTMIDRQDYEVLQPSSDAATIQAWYDAVQPDAKPSASPQPQCRACDYLSPGTRRRHHDGSDDLLHHLAQPLKHHLGACSGESAAATPVAPNEPRAWDPVPCS